MKNIINIILALVFLVLGLWNGFILLTNFQLEWKIIYRIVIAIVSIIIGIRYLLRLKNN